MMWNRNERRSSARSWLTFLPRDREFPLRPRMIIARFIAFLRGGDLRTGFARSYVDVHVYTGTYISAQTPTHTYIHVAGYISHRRSSLYVNCIRNSEYPANFLHTDHSRISAKRTSIRRSLHHKFRRTWCNAHLVEAPALHLGCTKRASLLSTVLRLCPANSRVFHVFVGTRVTCRAYRCTILNFHGKFLIMDKVS